jgi:hypothetical protein
MGPDQTELYLSALRELGRRDAAEIELRAV